MDHSHPPSFLSPTDPPAFEVMNPEGTTPLMLICDHASNQVPSSLQNLGLSDTELGYHIGWDIGAAAVTRHIAKTLDAPAAFCNYSRLVIDCNRPIGDPASIPDISDGIEIPANQGLTELDVIQRSEHIFWPYHRAITETCATLWQKGPAPALFSVHSFTPALMSRTEDRPWHAAVLWKRDPRLAQPLLHALRAVPDLKVGDNEPYSGWREAFSIDTHGATPGLPYCAIEIRQDLIETPEGQRYWGDLLSDILRDILSDTSILTANPASSDPEDSQ